MKLAKTVLAGYENKSRGIVFLCVCMYMCDFMCLFDIKVKTDMFVKTWVIS